MKNQHPRLPHLRVGLLALIALLPAPLSAAQVAQTSNPIGRVARLFNRKLVEEAEIALVRKELGDMLNRPNLRVLLDFKNVKRMSTAGVAMLRDFHRWLKPFGSTLAFCRIRTELRDIMEVFRMENIPYFHDKKSALLAKW